MRIGLVAVVISGGCSATAKVAANAPSLRIVTGLYPLQQAALQIGQGKVSVIDVVPAGSDPRTYQLTPAQTATVQGADLVVEAGGGFQPSFEAAAGTARRTWSLGAAHPAYAWLNPVAMASAASELADTMTEANPLAGALYRQGGRALVDELRSTAIDYQSTLAVCPVDAVFTADDAFAGVAHQFGFRDQTLSLASASSDATEVAASNATTVFREPWEPEALIDSVASRAHRKVRTLDTLLGPPAGGWPRGTSYLGLLEANMGALSTALSCPDQGSGP